MNISVNSDENEAACYWLRKILKRHRQLHCVDQNAIYDQLTALLNFFIHFGEEDQSVEQQQMEQQFLLTYGSGRLSGLLTSPRVALVDQMRSLLAPSSLPGSVRF